MLEESVGEAVDWEGMSVDDGETSDISAAANEGVAVEPSEDVADTKAEDIVDCDGTSVDDASMSTTEKDGLAEVSEYADVYEGFVDWAGTPVVDDDAASTSAAAKEGVAVEAPEDVVDMK
jgi:hypothetical protein